MYYRYPGGIIMPFDEACPDGWTRVSALDQKLLRGAASYTGTPGGTTAHTHTFDPASTKTLITTNHMSDLGTDFITNSNQHYHYVDIAATTSGSGSHIPQYINVIFCKKD